jgi:hypothetical protein
MSGSAPHARTIEARGGSFDLAEGRPSHVRPDQLPMNEWKRMVDDLVARDAGAPVRLVFCGGANQIMGYRLYYMLQYAKSQGLRHLSLLTDGLFWIDEATDWLIESRVDRIVILARGGQVDASLAARIEKMSAANRPTPSVQVRAASPGALGDDAA